MPPLTGVAVNMVADPEQTVVVGVEILTDGVPAEVTVIVTPLDITVCEFVQARDDVMSTPITSPLFNEEVWKVELTAFGILIPFFCHW